MSKQTDVMRKPQELARSGSGHGGTVAKLDPALTFAAFTEKELETLRKVCRDSDHEHLWRDVMGPAFRRAEGGK